MKYKVYGIVSFCLAFVVIASSLWFTRSEKKERYHQHLMAEPKAACSHSDDLFCTHLPLIQIDTNGVVIPGRVYNEDYAHPTVTEDGKTEIICDFQLIDNKKTNNHTTDSATTKSQAYINVRGRSSRAFDKSSYEIRLITKQGDNNPQSLIDMDPHHEWVLHGPFLDKTLIRNYMWYNIAGEIMDYAPNVRFCEVMINGEYMGLYVLAENITAGENGARLNLSVDKKDNSFTGYLLRMDQGSTNPIKNIDTFSVYSKRFPNKVDIVYPGASNLTPEIAESIRQDFSQFEKAIYSFDYDNKKYGYETMIDTQSFVDYFIINELTLNYDAGWLSTFIYKDVDGKYKMCIWDFNSACDNYQDTYLKPSSLQFQYNVWYVMLMKDEKFVEKIIDRYHELRKTYLSEEYLNSYIDETIEYLGDAVQRNFEKWGYTFDEGYDLLKPAERNPRNYEEAKSLLKNAIKQRGDWLDKNIHTLRQYAAESKAKKYNEHTD